MKNIKNKTTSKIPPWRMRHRGREQGEKNVIALEFRLKCWPFITDILPQMRNSPSFPL